MTATTADGALAIFILAAALTAMTPLAASAHRPLDMQGDNSDFYSAQLIPDHLVQRAISKELDPATPDYYRFEASAGERFFAQVTVPKLGPVRESAPSLALVGRGAGFAEIEDHTGSVVSYSVPLRS